MDMYLPALPFMTDEFGNATAMVSSSRLQPSLAGTDPDVASRDLFDTLAAGNSV
jgi:hypothetical protein